MAGRAKVSIKHDIYPIHNREHRKWDLRASDRRVADNAGNMFFKLFRSQKESLSRILFFKLRIKRQPNQLLTAGILRNKEHVNNLANSDFVIPEFKMIRGYPQYWHDAKKDIFAILR